MEPTLNPNPDEKIGVVQASGMPVKERIKSVAAARAVYDTVFSASADAQLRRARLKGLIDGNPPFEPKRLEELGLGYMVNVNFLEARAILDQKAATHYELFFEVPTLIQARVAVPLSDPSLASEWGTVVAEEFSKLLFDWSGFLVNMDKARREADAYGLGVMLWRDEWDWRPKAFNSGSFLPDSLASLDIEELELFCLRDRVSVRQLYKWALENEDIAKEEGWVPTAVKRLLKRKYVREESPGGATQDVMQTSDWESLQERIRMGDALTIPIEFDTIRIVHECVREADTGEVSHYIYSEEPVPEGEDEFLFRRARRFERMSQVVWWLPYNNGDDYVKSVRGLASMIEPHCDLSNRFLGRVFDAGFMTASLLIQPSTPYDLSKLQLVRMGVVTVVPSGLNVIQSSFQPQIQPLVQLRDISAAIMRNNTGVWKQHDEAFVDQEAPKTARQVAEEANKEAKMEKANIAYDYEHIQRLYREIFHRATRKDYVMAKFPYPGSKEARQFVSRCVMRGVPLNLLLLPGAFDIYATRAVGMGSWGAKMDITNQVLANRGLYDEAGRINALRDWLAVRVGYQNVDRYRSMQNRDLIPSNEHSMAMLENNDMSVGQAVVAGSDQNHFIHLQVHVPPIGELVQMVAETKGQGMDVPRAMALLQQALPHIQQHLAPLSEDPTREDLVKEVTKTLQAGAQAFKFLQSVQEAQAKEQQAVAEEQQGVVAEAQQVLADRDTQVKLAEIEKKYQLELIKQNSLNQMRADKTVVQNQIRQAGQNADISMKQQRQNAEIALAQQKTQADIENGRMKASAKAGK